MSWRTTTRTYARPGRPGGRWWLGAGLVAAGALALAYLMDPEQGRARRAELAGRSGHAARTARRRLAREARYVGKTVRGRVRHALDREPEHLAEGRELLDRVESELFEDRSIPHGRLNLEAEGTTVVVRGEVETAADVARIEEALRRVPGVTGVRNLLHLPGTPAPNKAAALEATDQISGGWPEEAPPDVDSER